MKIQKTKYLNQANVLYSSIIMIISILLIAFSGCSYSAQREAKMRKSIKQDNVHAILPKEKPAIEKKETPSIVEKEAPTVVKMEKFNGVYRIPVEINGSKMYFIFDTGASIISISETEVLFLIKQGMVSVKDVLGTENFADANGDISEGTIINLATVKIGDRTLRNIKASVVHNSIAPLLFGQSALEKFGKISIDNKRNEIVFE